MWICFMFPINKIYLNLDFVFTFKTHPKAECYHLVQLCFLCKHISIFFLLEILIILTKSTCGLFVLGRLCFSTHSVMCKMSIKDEINFPMVSYPFVCIIIPVVPPFGYLIFQYRRVCKYQRVIRIGISKKNRQHNGQRKKVQKEKQRSTKHPHQTKDRVWRTWKPEMNLCNLSQFST